jgi:putative transposase
LSQKRYVYWWADGVYFNVRLDEERACVLVFIGATEDGTQELLTVLDGYRESTQSWRELLGQLKRQGLPARRSRPTGIVDRRRIASEGE